MSIFVKIVAQICNLNSNHHTLLQATNQKP